MLKKQSTLFPENPVAIIPEIDLKEAEKLAAQIKASVEPQCDRIEVAGSIRRQKSKVHDVDFVVVTETDVDWQKINEKLKQLKAKPNAQEPVSSKHFCLAKMDSSKSTFIVQSPKHLAFTYLFAPVQQTITCGLQATPFQKE